MGFKHEWKMTDFTFNIMLTPPWLFSDRTKNRSHWQKGKKSGLWLIWKRAAGHQVCIWNLKPEGKWEVCVCVCCWHRRRSFIHTHTHHRQIQCSSDRSINMTPLSAERAWPSVNWIGTVKRCHCGVSESDGRPAAPSLTGTPSGSTKQAAGCYSACC